MEHRIGGGELTLLQKQGAYSDAAQGNRRTAQIAYDISYVSLRILSELETGCACQGPMGAQQTAQFPVIIAQNGRNCD